MPADRSILEQRQIDGLPGPSKKSPDKNSKESIRDLRDIEDLWGEGIDFLSLDPCSCPPTCPPKGLLRFFSLAPPREASPSGVLAWLAKVLLTMFLAMVPAASIAILYAIPTTYARLGAIVAEAAVLISGLALLILMDHDILGNQDILSFMVG